MIAKKIYLCSECKKVTGTLCTFIVGFDIAGSSVLPGKILMFCSKKCLDRHSQKCEVQVIHDDLMLS